LLRFASFREQLINQLSTRSSYKKKDSSKRWYLALSPSMNKPQPTCVGTNPFGCGFDFEVDNYESKKAKADN
jgi:hypothetical protein